MQLQRAQCRSLSALCPIEREHFGPLFRCVSDRLPFMPLAWVCGAVYFVWMDKGLLLMTPPHRLFSSNGAIKSTLQRHAQQPSYFARDWRQSKQRCACQTKFAKAKQSHNVSCMETERYRKAAGCQKNRHTSRNYRGDGKMKCLKQSACSGIDFSSSRVFDQLLSVFNKAI
jgi:hypothetical protein